MNKRFVTKCFLIPLVFLTLSACIGGVHASTDNGLSAHWESTGTAYVEIVGSERIAVDITSRASITRGALLTVKSDNSKLFVTPSDQITVNNLEAVPQTVYFSAGNLGVEQKISNIAITIISCDTYTGQERSRETIYATLLPTLSTPTSGVTNAESTMNQLGGTVDWTWVIVAVIMAITMLGCVALFLRQRKP